MNVSIILKLFDGVTAPLRRVSQAIDEASRAMEKTRARADKAFERADRIKQASDSMFRFAGKMRDGLSDVVKEASDFEQAMLGVAKQVEGARDPSGKLTTVYSDMRKQIQMLGREVPMSTTAIAEMVAAGARMSIPKDELIEFTHVAAMMAEAFELPAGPLAEQMGKIKILFKLGQKDVRGLADAVNYLDDNAISKGGDIIEFLQHVGGSAGSVAISARQVAALGSTLLTLGERTHKAGYAVDAMLQKFGAASKLGSKARDALREIGLSASGVQKGMQIDAQGTMLSILDSLNKLPKENRIGVMVDLVGLEHSDTLAKLAVGVEEYRKQIALASSQKAEGSMSREFQARLATTAAQWEITKNRVSELAVNIGEKLLPVINKLLERLGPIVSKAAEWIEEHGTLVKILGGSIGVITAVAFALGSVMTVISVMVGAQGVFLLAKSFGIFALVLRATMIPALLSFIPVLGTFAAGLWAVAAPAIAAAAPFILLAIAIGAVVTAMLQMIRLVREWDKMDFIEVLKGMDAAVADRSFWKTMTLNPFEGLSTPNGGGLQPTSQPMAGTLGVGEAPMGTLVVKFDENNQPQVKSMQATGFNLEAEANSGGMMRW